MGKYKIGDRVECCAEDLFFNPDIYLGDTGTICDLQYGSENSIGVCWDKELPKGHTCDWTCIWPHGWYSLTQYIRLKTPGGQSCKSTDDFDVDEAEIDKFLRSLAIK